MLGSTQAVLIQSTELDPTTVGEWWTVSTTLAMLAVRDDGGASVAIDRLRAVARSAVAALPEGHPLHGVDVDTDPAVALIRLLARAAPVVGDVEVPALIDSSV